jgi:tRNA(Ile)-lysidine synthase
MLKNQLKKRIRKSCFTPENRSYLLAVSGGADSMVLAHCFKDIQFQVAHINYKLRGEDSDLDQKTVEDFCEKNDINFIYTKFQKKIRSRNILFSFGQENCGIFFQKGSERRKSGISSYGASSERPTGNFHHQSFKSSRN